MYLQVLQVDIWKYFSKMGIVYKHYNGSKNLYYLVKNFKDVKESAGIRLVTPEELEEGTDLRNSIEDIYENMVSQLKKGDFRKKD